MSHPQIPDKAVEAMKRALCSEWRLEDKPDEVWIPEEEMDRACVDALIAAYPHLIVKERDKWTKRWLDLKELNDKAEAEAAYPHLMAENTRLQAKLDAYEAALRQACHDAWADGEGAMAGYLRAAALDEEGT